MIRRSIRRQLLKWLLIPLFLLILIDSTILYRIAMHFEKNAFDHSLVDTTHDVSQLINQSHPDQKPELNDETRRIILSDQFDKMYYNVRDMDGNFVGGDKELVFDKNQDNLDTYFYFAVIDGQIVRVASNVLDIVSNKSTRKVRIQVAETLNKRTRLAGQILLGIVIPQVILLLAVFLLTWSGIGRGLQPLWALQSALSKRSHRDLSRVDLPGIPDEVRVLVTSINLLMAQMQNLLESQNQFIADAAHQLRTPLAGLLAQIELAQDEKKPEELEQSLASMAKSGQRLVHLVNQLLALARTQPEAKRYVEFAHVNLKKLVSDVTADMVSAADRKNIDLGFECEEGQYVILGDVIQLQELVYNLLDNAIRYTPKDGKITVELHKELENIVLSVIDNGLGIPLLERDKVFERFYRVANNGQDGSGLGLAIVADIVQVHNATIDLETPESGIGTKITVTFKEA